MACELVRRRKRIRRQISEEGGLVRRMWRTQEGGVSASKKEEEEDEEVSGKFLPLRRSMMRSRRRGWVGYKMRGRGGGGAVTACQE